MSRRGPPERARSGLRLRAWQLLSQGTWFLEHGAARKAAALYAQALRAIPTDRGAYLWRALALAELGRHSEAIEQMKEATAREPDCFITRLFLARVLYDAGEVAGALDLLASHLQTRKNAQARGLQALCELRLGKAEQAGEFLRHRGLPAASWLLARFLVVLEGLAAARARALPEDRNPRLPAVHTAAPAGNADRYVTRGLLHMRAERWSKALEAFGRAFEADPEEAMAGYGIGMSLYYLGRPEEAQDWLQKVQGQLDSPFSDDAQAALGNLAAQRGDSHDALARLRPLAAKGAAGPEVYYAIGLARLQTGRPDLALRAFLRCATPEIVRQRLAEVMPQPAFC